MNSSIAAKRDIEEKRSLGAYYTPERLSDILARWAIRTSGDMILEPSFGGCGFLRSASRSLLSLGSVDPRQLIYGCDIDPVAFQFLAGDFGSPVDLGRFLQQDFLDVHDPAGWPAGFDVVMGNPPYIPFQRIEGEKRAELNKRVVSAGQLGGRAGLWAYFVAHSISMLRKGGRMAWVLPGAYLHADYARELRGYLATHFAKLACFVVHERLFLTEGTDEETVILLADSHSLEPHDACSVTFREAKSLGELETLVAEWSASDGAAGQAAHERPALLNLEPAARQAFESLAGSKICNTLGDLAEIGIGVVTGANNFFVLGKKQLAPAGLLPDDCDPIVTKFKQVKGLTYGAQDHETALAEGFRGYLVDGLGREENERVSAYIDTFPEERRAATATFKKRPIWYRTGDTKIPDAFFPVMHHLGPRLALNSIGCNSTNTIHRVYFKDGMDEVRRQLLCISVLSSFSQVSAEIVGRRYGSGVLKHEPSEAKEIAVLMPELPERSVRTTFRQIDAALRKNDVAGAMALADALIESALPAGATRDGFAMLPAALEKVRERRRPKRPPVGQTADGSTEA